MTKKLILLVNKQIQPENLDSLTVQEVLTSGNLYGMYFREKLDELFEFIKLKFNKDYSNNSSLSLIQTIENLFKMGPKIG